MVDWDKPIVVDGNSAEVVRRDGLLVLLSWTSDAGYRAAGWFHARTGEYQSAQPSAAVRNAPEKVVRWYADYGRNGLGLQRRSLDEARRHEEGNAICFWRWECVEGGLPTMTREAIGAPYPRPRTLPEV